MRKAICITCSLQHWLLRNMLLKIKTDRQLAHTVNKEENWWLLQLHPAREVQDTPHTLPYPMVKKKNSAVWCTSVSKTSACSKVPFSDFWFMISSSAPPLPFPCPTIPPTSSPPPSSPHEIRTSHCLKSPTIISADKLLVLTTTYKRQHEDLVHWQQSHTTWNSTENQLLGDHPEFSMSRRLPPKSQSSCRNKMKKCTSAVQMTT